MFESITNAVHEFEVILRPDRNEPNWWAGAPSVARASGGDFFLAARMREAISPRGMRGYEVRILRSPDGRSFEPVAHITREAAGRLVFERPCILRDPRTGLFKLYGCASYLSGWVIWKLDDVADPATFDAATIQDVLVPDLPADEFELVKGYKDPFIFWGGELWHMFVIGYDRVERPYHFTSPDGLQWDLVSPAPVLENTGWHNFYTRPACVVPLGVGYLFVYEGSAIGWRDPAYNIDTGLAYSPDLHSFIDLTPGAPLLASSTPGSYHTFRYSHWLPVGGEMYLYYEAACPDDTNEVRLSRFPLNVVGLEI